MKTWPVKEISTKGMVLYKSLWELGWYMKVSHISAHQKNPLPGSQGNWNQQADILQSLKVATKLHEMSGNGVLQQLKNGLYLDIFLLYPLRHKMPIKLSVSQQGTETEDGSMADAPGEGSEHSWQIRLKQVPLRDIQIDLERNRH